jgi:FkbM family methyltransferase
MLCSMCKRLGWIIFGIVGVGAILTGLTALLATPAQRAAGFARIDTAWTNAWPFNRGAHIPKRFLPLLGRLGLVRPVRVQVEPKVSLVLDPLDWTAKEILMTGTYEPGTWRIIEEHLPRGGAFIDVGAHIGYYSLKAARQVGESGRVIAIEPNPLTVEQLRENVRASGASEVAVQEIACSDRESVLELFASPRNFTGKSSLSRANAAGWPAVGTPVPYRVRARPLDAVSAEMNLKRVDVIKVDVEGAELLVLKGARETLARFRPVLVVEIIDSQLKQMGTSAAELAQFLTGAGYAPGRAAEQNREWLPPGKAPAL